MSPLALLLVVIALVVVALVVGGVVAVRLASLVLAKAASATDRVRVVRADASVRVRAKALPPGARRELAALQLRLRESARATAAHAAGAPAPLAALVADIDAGARRLEQRIGVVAREPDAMAAAAELPRLRREVGDLCAAGTDVRAALRHVERPLGDADDTATLALQAATVRRALDELRAVGHPGQPASLSRPMR